MTRWDVERAVMASDLPAPARLVMFVLLAKTDAKTAAIPAEHTPSLTGLTAATRLARSTLASTLNRLERDGWVTRRRPAVEQSRKGVRTRYRLSVPSPPDGLASPLTGLGVVRSPDQPSPLTGPRIRPSPISDQERAGLAMVAETLEIATGKKISQDDARQAVAFACKDRAVEDPYRYTVGAIRKDAKPWRFAPTPQPPPVREVLT